MHFTKLCFFKPGIVIARGKINSVGNPRDQMTKYTEFVTIFSSASGRIF